MFKAIGNFFRRCCRKKNVTLLASDSFRIAPEITSVSCAKVDTLLARSDLKKAQVYRGPLSIFSDPNAPRGCSDLMQETEVISGAILSDNNDIPTCASASFDVGSVETNKGHKIVKSNDAISNLMEEPSVWKIVHKYLEIPEQYNLAIASPHTAFNFKNKDSALAVSFVLQALKEKGQLERPPKLTDIPAQASCAGLASFSALSGAGALGYGIYLGIERKK